MRILSFLQAENKIAPKKRVIIIVLIIVIVAYGFCLPKNLFNVSYSTVVVDRNNELLGARIADDNQWRFPEIDTVPEKFKTCLVQFEDQYFYCHWGVNPVSIGRAVIQNVKQGKVVSGGSTLSMQTIRISRNRPRTWFTKIKEIILATRLEFRYSKKKILALYASHAPFGGNVVGLEAASWRYFGRSPQNLSWAEAATLAVLPNSPALINFSRNRKLLLEKRNRLLGKLYANSVIDESTYELALSETLPSEPLPLPQIAPHLTTYFYKNDKGKYCHSTINKNMQLQVENILERWYGEFSQNDIKNIAAIIIDVRTNQVLAYCGNINFESKRSANQVDIIRSPRSTGSILKPLLYCAMLQEGQLLPKMLLPDIPVNINGFMPQNFNKEYDGAVPASEALCRSLNIPMVCALRTYSVPKFYDFLKKAGYTTLNRPSSHYGLSLILGGAESTLWDIVSSYNCMAKTLNYYLANKDYTSQTLLQPDFLIEEQTVKSKQNKLYNAAAIWQTFEVIKEVNRPEEIDWRNIPSMQKIAWKTGTSYGFRDAWAVGVTPKYVVGVWVGNANGEGRPGLTGAKTAGPVMFDIFNILPRTKWFDIPYGELIESEICRQSGCLKSRFCPDTDTVLICKEGIKTEICRYHFQINVTLDGRYRVYENCAGDEGMRQESIFILPPVWEWYYKRHHSDYKSLPPFKAGCGQQDDMPMQFIYPQKNAVISLPKQLDGKNGTVIFELAHYNSNATVYWHLDQEYVGSTNYFHQLSLSPPLGRHVITVVDNEGNTLSSNFQIVK